MILSLCFYFQLQEKLISDTYLNYLINFQSNGLATDNLIMCKTD